MSTLHRNLALMWMGLAFGPSIAADELDRIPAVARPKQVDDLRRRFGIDAYLKELKTLSHMKIAVLDHGFDGVDGKRAYLPINTTVVEHYDVDWIRKHDLGDPAFQKPFEPGNHHGRSMAEIVWAMTGSAADGPQFHLLNSNGPTLFRRAVQYAIDQKVHVILFCGHFEGAGNYDGRGPINAIVTEAVKSGILWINAAGNLHNKVTDRSIRDQTDGWLRIGSVGDPTALHFRNRIDENRVTITLTWSDYKETEDAGTEKDLDLFVEDSKGKVIAKSELRQINGNQPAGEGQSRNPRERVVINDLPASDSDYRIRVRYKEGAFGVGSRLRVLVEASRNENVPGTTAGTTLPGFTFVDASAIKELYPPADHPGVITVGNMASSVGPTSDGRNKPEITISDSRVYFSNGEELEGSSNAAAMFAGTALLMKAAEPGLTADHIRKLRITKTNTVALSSDRPTTGPRLAIDFDPPLRTPGGIPLAPLTENQIRALRHAEEANRNAQARGMGPGSVWLSLRLADGRSVSVAADQLFSRRVQAKPLNDQLNFTEPAPATKPSENGLTPNWSTPTPRALAAFVRSGLVIR